MTESRRTHAIPPARVANRYKRKCGILDIAVNDGFDHKRRSKELERKKGVTNGNGALNPFSQLLPLPSINYEGGDRIRPWQIDIAKDGP